MTEKFNKLKDQLRKLEANFAEALSIQVGNKTKYELTGESISNARATNEQFSSLVMDQRARRDEYANVISNQLEAIEALEAKTDATGKKNLEEAFMWYKKFLGFQVVGGEGMKFVFNKIDIQNPDNEYSFCIKLNKDRYNHTSTITDSSPPALSIDTGRESTTTTNRSHSRSRAKNQDNPTKRGAHPSNLLCSTRRSPRVAAAGATNRY